MTATPTSIAPPRSPPPAPVAGTLTCATSHRHDGASTWTQSTSARVTGYRVNVHFSDGYVQTVQLDGHRHLLDAGHRHRTTSRPSAVRYSVTTLTDYGWTTESAPTGCFRC